jgi:hypothetical protein
MESELDVLGGAGKLAKDVVYLWRQNFEKIKNFLFQYAAITSNNHFLVLTPKIPSVFLTNLCSF